MVKLFCDVDGCLKDADRFVICDLDIILCRDHALKLADDQILETLLEMSDRAEGMLESCSANFMYVGQYVQARKQERMTARQAAKNLKGWLDRQAAELAAKKPNVDLADKKTSVN